MESIKPTRKEETPVDLAGKKQQILHVIGKLESIMQRVNASTAFANEAAKLESIKGALDRARAEDAEQEVLVIGRNIIEIVQSGTDSIVKDAKQIKNRIDEKAQSIARIRSLIYNAPKETVTEKARRELSDLKDIVDSADTELSQHESGHVSRAIAAIETLASPTVTGEKSGIEFLEYLTNSTEDKVNSIIDRVQNITNISRKISQVDSEITAKLSASDEETKNLVSSKVAHTDKLDTLVEQPKAEAQVENKPSQPQPLNPFRPDEKHNAISSKNASEKMSNRMIVLFAALFFLVLITIFALNSNGTLQYSF